MAKVTNRHKADGRIAEQAARILLMNKGNAMTAGNQRLRQCLHRLIMAVKRWCDNSVMAHPTGTSDACFSAARFSLPVQKQATRS